MSEYFRNPRPDMFDYVPATAKRVLDVGCAEGSFGLLLKQKLGAEVWGIELNSRAAAIARERLDKVLQGSITEAPAIPERYFDCICFNDVLEHLAEPAAALALCKGLLARNGVVVASIPNVRYFPHVREYLLEKDWRYRDAGILDRTHLRFFTQKSIPSLFEDQGYSVECVEGINPFAWGRARTYHVMNLLLLNQLEDMRYLQFAVVARPRQ